MVLGEPLFLAFLLPAALIANLLPGGFPRATFALVCSIVYYLTFPYYYMAILIYAGLVAYVGALLIERFSHTKQKPWLVSGLIALCVAPLILFKYLAPWLFFPMATGTNWQFTLANLVAPVGLSFYTFALVGYLADVALGLVSAERAPHRLVLFAGFFPYVTSGPIPRTTDVLPQLSFCREFTADRGMMAVAEICAGVIMKFWIADTLGQTLSPVFNAPASCPPLEQLVATILFAFQLYGDFAGYSLIAIGSARLFGIDLMPNFRQPFLAGSIPEFWRRWHISLFSWLRDYVYTPLFLKWRRGSATTSSAAIFITLVLVGLWHGSGLGFVLFGVAHGLMLVFSLKTLSYRTSLWERLRVPMMLVHICRVTTVFVIVTLSMLLFRARNVSEACNMYAAIFSPGLLKGLADLFLATPDASIAFKYIRWQAYTLDFLLAAALIFGDLFARSTLTFSGLPGVVRAAFYTVGALVVLYQAIAAQAVKPFVYLQF